MTCTTTHYACDCVLERMKKLESLLSAAKVVAAKAAEGDVGGIPRLEKAIAALELTEESK